MSAPSDPQAEPMPLLDLGAVSVDTFAPHVDTAFTHAVHPDWVFTLAQAEVTSAEGFGGRPTFSLVFTGPANGPQGIWPLTHPVLGALQLFLVPVGATRYEAVFT